MKKLQKLCLLLSLFICLSLVFNFTPAAFDDNEDIPAAELCMLFGDADLDGRITVADARLILRHAVKLETLTAEMLKRVDIDNDGKLSPSKARTVIRMAIKLDGPKAHTVEIDEKVAPGCTTTGLTEGSHCRVCDKVLVKQEILEATDHSEVIIDSKPATCTEKGLTEGKKCSRCDIILVAQETVAATGHAWCEWTVTKAASIDDKGEEKRICNTCNISETRSIDAIAQDEYEDFKEKIGVYYTDNVKYEYLKNHFDYAAYIQVYTLNKESSNETKIINEFKKHFGFVPTANVVVEKVGMYLVDDKVETVYSYSINDTTYPFMKHEPYDVYHQICTDGISHWVGFAIEGSADDNWFELMSTSEVQALREEMYEMFYEKTGYSEEYINSHKSDFCIGYISQAGTMRTQDGKLIDILYIYCRETSKE